MNDEGGTVQGISLRSLRFGVQRGSGLSSHRNDRVSTWQILVEDSASSNPMMYFGHDHVINMRPECIWASPSSIPSTTWNLGTNARSYVFICTVMTDTELQLTIGDVLMTPERLSIASGDMTSV